jgi:hypothetical protein
LLASAEADADALASADAVGDADAVGASVASAESLGDALAPAFGGATVRTRSLEFAGAGAVVAATTPPSSMNAAPAAVRVAASRFLIISMLSAGSCRPSTGAFTLSEASTRPKVSPG